MKPYEDLTTHVDHDLNNQMIKLIIKAVNLCSNQSLPLRNHRDNSSDLFSRDGDFLAKVATLADMDPILKDHLEMLK